MGHVGGETFDGVHALPQGRRHVAEGPGKIADFISLSGKIGDHHMAVVMAAHLFRRLGQMVDGPRDGARQVQRQQHGHGQGDGENLKNVEPHRTQGGQNVLAFAGKKDSSHDLLVAPHRHGDI